MCDAGVVRSVLWHAVAFSQLSLLLWSGWQIAVYGRPLLVVLFIVIWQQLSVALSMCASWTQLSRGRLSVSVNCGSVEACSVCYSMCRAFKVKSERGMVAGEMSSIRLDDFQKKKKKMASTSKSAAGLFDPFLNLKTNIKLLQFRENILACCLLGASVIWSIHLFMFLEHTHGLFWERLYIGWRSTGNSRLLALVLRVRF